MSAINTRTTDMRPFEGALDECFCHTCWEDGEAMCGMVVEDPASLHDWVEPGPDGRCGSCGRRSCPECDRLDAVEDE